ncbi:hypothetical protein BLOT_007843 [Blomia tropicalis]|nr:hypothetical protein BLOT_007843 [Blomia tropicalis]
MSMGNIIQGDSINRTPLSINIGSFDGRSSPRPSGVVSNLPVFHRVPPALDFLRDDSSYEARGFLGARMQRNKNDDDVGYVVDGYVSKDGHNATSKTTTTTPTITTCNRHQMVAHLAQHMFYG